jgi:hypothetical protein
MSFEVAALVGACLVASFCSGVAGFSFNLVAAGMLFHVLPPQQTAPVLVTASLIIQVGTLGVVWKAIRWPVLVPYLAAGLLGTPLGVAVLRVADGALIKAGIGLLLVTYAGYMLARLALRLAPPRVEAGAAADAAVGFAGGVLAGIGGFSGALPTMWTDLKGLRKDDARAIFQPFIVATHLVAVVSLAAGGFFDAAAGWALLMALPALGVGTYLGVLAYRRLPAEGFRLVLLGMLFVSGASLLL